MGKDSFIFHMENAEDLEELSLEQVGELFLGMIQYTRDHEEPTFTDKTLKTAWKPIRRRLKYDSDSYEHRSQVNAENGSQGGAPKGNQNARKQPKTTENKRKQPKTSLKDKDKDKDNDTDKEKDIDKDSIIFFNSATERAEKEKNESEPFINPEVDSRFERFKAMRLEKGKSLNADAEKIIKDKIVKFSKGDPKTAVQIIDQAIEGGYLTVIPLQKPPEQKKDDSGPGFAQHDYDMDELRRRAKA